MGSVTVLSKRKNNMKIRNISVCLCFVLLNSFACSNLAVKSSAQLDNSMNSKSQEGVLVLNVLSLFEDHELVKVLNSDSSLFTEIKRINDQEPFSDKLNEENIQAYYPDYFIIHFKSNIISDSLYSVSIGNEIKFITKNRYTEFLPWPDYIMKYYLTTDKNNPLRQTPSDEGEIIKDVDYAELSFVGIEISGDWVKVKCDKECEGCGRGNVVSGWIRWRENGKLIVTQYYVC